jgi:NitT/TauT family transport system substrate-binding protein
VGVFAPFTLQAAKRPGSHVLFDSSDFPGTIPDHLAVDPKLITDDSDAVQSLVDAWYETLDYLRENPDDATAIMADKAELTAADYEQFADGTTLFTVQQAVAAFTESDEPTSLLHTAKLINPFLVKSGLATKEASLTGLFDASFTKHYADSHPG